MRIITGKYGVINGPKRLPSMYKTKGQFDYAVYRANLKNKAFTDEFSSYSEFKTFMNESREQITSTMGITGPTKLNEETLRHAGYSQRFMTAEEVGLSNIYKEMQDLPEFDQVDWNNIKWDDKLKGYVSGGMIITFNYGDEYWKHGLYNIAPLVVS